MLKHHSVIIKFIIIKFIIKFEKYNIKITNEREWAWPRLLNNHLGLILEDRSESGAGAERVWRQAWEYCDGNLDKAKQTLFNKIKIGKKVDRTVIVYFFIFSLSAYIFLRFRY